MSLNLILYHLFVILSLVIPGYALLHWLGFFQKRTDVKLCLGIVASIFAYALISTLAYVAKLDGQYVQVVMLVALGVSATYFFQKRLYRELKNMRVPILAFLIGTVIASSFLSLSLNHPAQYIPDPEVLSGRNYDTLNVKVLNIAQTPANDNSVPYRQAQFYVNHSDPAKDSFIDEWGVHFFQRTPLLGAVTAGYFTMLGEEVPVGYLWSDATHDVDKTYQKFQVIAHILNTLYILPAFILIKKLFERRTAIVSTFFLATSHFFLFNAFFSWPKTFVAFFVLLSWVLLLERDKRSIYAAAVVGGLAYMAHDLSILFVGASALYLISQRRYRDMLVISIGLIIFMLPWLIVSSLIYNKPSSFPLYPFSVDGLPQLGQRQQVIEKFFNTSPLEILSIRGDTIFYLLSPYDLIYSTGGQALLRRMWAVGLFSVPGALGLGLVVPTLIGLWRLRKYRLLMLIYNLIPVLGVAVIFGWRFPRSVGALHFMQASIAILTAVAVNWLVRLKQYYWVMLAFALHVIQLGFFILFSYYFKYTEWFTSTTDLAAIAVIIACLSLSGYAILAATTNRKSRLIGVN